MSTGSKSRTTTSSTSAKRATKPKVEAKRHELFSVQVAFPLDEEDGWRYEAIGEAHTFAIARDIAYSLAQQGLRVRYPKPENTRHDDLPDGWYTVDADKAGDIRADTWQRYAVESLADRASILCGEMKARSRVGNILGELRHIADETLSRGARSFIRQGMLDLSRSVFAPLSHNSAANIGWDALPNVNDILAEAATAQGIEAEGPCPSCGGFHGESTEGLTLAEVFALAEAQYEGDADPILEAMVEVEGVQA
jgi:hypothetical protein